MGLLPKTQPCAYFLVSSIISKKFVAYSSTLIMVGSNAKTGIQVVVGIEKHQFELSYLCDFTNTWTSICGNINGLSEVVQWLHMILCNT